MAHLLLKGGHAWYKQHGCELNGTLHIEVRSGQRLQKLLEGLLEEGIVLILTHLQLQDSVSSEAPCKLAKNAQSESTVQNFSVLNMYAHKVVR